MGKVTNIEVLKSYKGEEVELPEFGKDQPFVALMHRPSMLSLAKNGKIPNNLLTTANGLFESGKDSLNSMDSEMLEKVFGVMDIICEAALVEPSWQQLKDANIQLTDEQVLAIFSYTQVGVKSLENFRS